LPTGTLTTGVGTGVGCVVGVPEIAAVGLGVTERVGAGTVGLATDGAGLEAFGVAGVVGRWVEVRVGVGVPAEPLTPSARPTSMRP
jgi:hypothetical protein